MTHDSYRTLLIDKRNAESIALDTYGIEGEASFLPGELDMNFRIKSNDASYVLKISRPDTDRDYIDFQQKILSYLEKYRHELNAPRLVKDLQGNIISSMQDEKGLLRQLRMYSWIEGRLWSDINPQSDGLLSSLGAYSGKLTSLLTDFDHPYAHRNFEWDVLQASWTAEHLYLFSKADRAVVDVFLKEFEHHSPAISRLRKAVVHNDVNDNNIVVEEKLLSPQVKGVIDFGDAIYTAVINDLAICLAYAMMDKPDPLRAAGQLVRAYHASFPLQEKELEHLYLLVAMRLIISVTKSAINKNLEPDNEYLLISEKPAWDLLRKWSEINKYHAHFYFREACGFDAHPGYKDFVRWTEGNKISVEDIFPTTACEGLFAPDMSISSAWLGNRATFEDLPLFSDKIKVLQRSGGNELVAGGYLEIRPFYLTDQYMLETNNGPEYRSVHLGMDFWLDEGTPVHTPYDGKVISYFNNGDEKDYGPTLILEHQFGEENTFYSLYGHLSLPGMSLVKVGQEVKKGEMIGLIGGYHENGGWPPHVHFQLMLSLMGNTNNFPGVALYKDKKIWAQLCPNPGLILKEANQVENEINDQELLAYRNRHLGKSLSLSYDNPLLIERGDGAYLIDHTGRRYLDTVNNVAHVGHEHPRVVAAGQDQMAVLNTNTRYLHRNITDLAEKLLKTFPPELSVVHFVNSGSEANELALRMARTCSGQDDMIAVEAGYHGNTAACIDISSYKFDGKGGSGAPENTHIIPLPDSFRGLYRGADTGLRYASHIEQKLKEINEKGRGVAAFICESIISCGGQIELPNGYLQEAYKLIRNAGGLCIADEVQVGCGRLGDTFWGFQLHNVIPDIVTIGKPIGNGHPLAAVVCTAAVAEAFNNGMEYFNTFGGNPVSCAIGLEVLNVIEDEGLQENAKQTGDYLKDQLIRLQDIFPIIADVRGKGLFLGFELNGSKMQALGDHAAYLANRMKELGVLMSTDGPDYNVLKIKPPLVFSRQNADEMIKRLSVVLNEDFMRSYE